MLQLFTGILQPFLTGKEKVEGLAIILISSKKEMLLGVSGKEQADAVFHFVNGTWIKLFAVIPSLQILAMLMAHAPIRK